MEIGRSGLGGCHAGSSTGAALGQRAPGCEVAHSAAQFRSTARQALNRLQHYLLVNFSGTTLSDDNQGGGHFSPLAAYNGKADDLLLLDVARYKCPPFWVDTNLLWQAMATMDTSSGRHRGYIVLELES
jgi:Phytochelatin synthase